MLKMGIQKTGFLRSFSEYANKSYASYLNQFGVVPNHQPILNSLITKKNIIAIEMPVWAIAKNGEYFSGLDKPEKIISKQLELQNKNIKGEAIYLPNENRFLIIVKPLIENI